MPSSRHEEYRNFVFNWINNHQKEPEAVAGFENHAEALLLLWHLDLEPARAILMQGYAKNPRGSKPWDPVIILRSLLLSVLLRRKINSWAKDLKASRVLRIICGMKEGDRIPGVGTFYDFMHRLNNGAVRRGCIHQQRPSDAERKKSKTPRAKDKQQPKKKQDKKNTVDQEDNNTNVTERIVSVLKERQLQPNANDLLGRLAQILFEVAVNVSAKKGLLGDPGAILVSGDGSPLRSGGNGHGRKTCKCPKTSHCQCQRRYSDPDADWGWDSYRESYFFGHHIYEIVCSASGHDLPCALRLDPASTSDYVASLKTIEHLRKTFVYKSYKSHMKIGAAAFDAGHDGIHNYRFMLHHDIKPFIPLKTKAPANHPKRDDLQLSPRGVPLCPAGAEMAFWGTTKNGEQVFVCPVKAKRRRVCPHAPDDFPHFQCKLGKLAPTVGIKTSDNERLFPPIPRNHKEHQKMMNLRSGSERSFSVKKERFELENSRHRRKSFWLIRLHLMAILQHALAWVSQNDSKDFMNYLLGNKMDLIAA